MGTEDDPRVRGGTGVDHELQHAHGGRSPRTRGNLLEPRPDLTTGGTIPAYAGEPSGSRHGARHRGDDPRVRGGTWSQDAVDFASSGRSPRTRGNRLDGAPLRCARGTIPAYAGEPPYTGQGVSNERDDPRVRGGTTRGRAFLISGEGRSPRTRGNLLSSFPTSVFRGTIPAYAGEPLLHFEAVRLRGDDPRVRGGTGTPISHSTHSGGRSPRTRGNLEPAHFPAIVGGTIPAYAGEPAAHHHATGFQGDDPRVRGGTRKQSQVTLMCVGRSPRTRGNLVLAFDRRTDRGTIPAYAGEPSEAVAARSPTGDDPRVRGGTIK